MKFIEYVQDATSKNVSTSTATLMDNDNNSKDDVFYMREEYLLDVHL